MELRGSASAGSRGDAVRSDVWVEIQRRESGGNEVALTGKAADLFSRSTSELVEHGLQFFGLEKVLVRIEDSGALPFVLMARLEAAVRRLWRDKEFPAWLPPPAPQTAASERNHPRLSRLYLPGNNPKFMINAPVHKPSGLILDLEDSVAPSEKDAARVLVRNALVHLDFLGAEKIVRINQGDYGLADLQWVVPYGVQLILIPKVETSETVIQVATRIAELRSEFSIDYPIWLMPIIESAKGAWFAYEIASSHETVVALAIGLEDYTADIGAERTLEGRESFWARSQVLNAARAAGVQPIDTVFSDVADMEGLRESVIEAKSLGFEGKGCIHPRQIEVIHQAFAPSETELNKAKRIVRAYEDALSKGLGVISLGSKMIDPPVLKRALRTIESAEREGLIAHNWRQIE